MCHKSALSELTACETLRRSATKTDARRFLKIKSRSETDGSFFCLPDLVLWARVLCLALEKHSAIFFRLAAGIDKAARTCHNINMKITVINGTENLGAVEELKQTFLRSFAEYAEVKEWYMPKDLPDFCRGCGICVRESETKCRDARFFMPLWKSVCAADLIVFATPAYADHIPASLKNLFDHLEWAKMTHRPRPSMFGKRAVVIVAGNSKRRNFAANYIKDRMRGWGLGAVVSCGTESGSESKLLSFAEKYLHVASDMCVKTPFCVKRKFAACRAARLKTIEKEKTVGELSADSRYWTESGLLLRKPWKKQ